MKKLIAGLFTALAVALGLVTVSGSAPAVAGYVVVPTPTVGVAGATPGVVPVRRHNKVVLVVKSGVAGVPDNATVVVKVLKAPRKLHRPYPRTTGIAINGQYRVPGSTFPRHRGYYTVRVKTLFANGVVAVKYLTVKIKN